jgi:xylulokinase
MPHGKGVVLGIDLGTSSFKAVAIEADGTVASISRVSTPFVAHVGGVDMSYSDLESAVEQLVGGIDVEPGQVRAIGVAGMGESGAVLDSTPKVVTPIAAWYDTRGGPYAEELRGRFAGARWEVLGRPLRAQSSIALLAYWVASKVRTVKWLGVVELCAWMLTGEMFSEPSLAARTSAYDITRDAYEHELLQAIGAPPDVFPETRAAGTSPAHTSTEFAARLGVRRGTPVTIAGHDHLVGAYGAGADVVDLVDSVGTSELLLRYTGTTPDLGAVLAARAEVARAPGDRLWAVTLCPGHPGVVLANLRRLVGDPPLARLEQLAMRSSVADREVQRVRLRALGLLTDSPGPSGSVEVGTSGPGAIWAAALEELAECGQNGALSLDRVVGPAERVLVIGGGSGSSYWMAQKEHLAERPMRVSGIDEPVATGAALIAGGLAGFWDPWTFAAASNRHSKCPEGETS